MSSDELAQAERASQVVRAAEARGTWTNEDRGALVGAIAHLPGPVQAEMVALVADALNHGRLRIEDGGSVL